MIRLLLLGICILAQSILIADEKPMQTPQPTASVKLPTPPQILNVHVTAPQPNVHIENNNVNTNQLYFIQQLRDLAEYGRNTQQYAKTQLLDVAHVIKEYAAHNYGKVFLGTIAGLYGYIWLRLLYLHRSTTSAHSWAAWKKTQQVDELDTMTQAQVAEKLVLAIQEKYQSAEKIADFISPFVAFVNDINREIKNLKSYIWFLDTLKRLNMIGLFPGYQKSVIHARERLKRVLYLKNVFSAWIAEYKLQHSTIIHQQAAGMRISNKEAVRKKKKNISSFFEKEMASLKNVI
jgi:hypothetical protein